MLKLVFLPVLLYIGCGASGAGQSTKEIRHAPESQRHTHIFILHDTMFTPSRPLCALAGAVTCDASTGPRSKGCPVAVCQAPPDGCKMVNRYNTTDGRCCNKMCNYEKDGVRCTFQPPVLLEYDACANKKDRDACSLCDPADGDCMETSVMKVCEAGKCVSGSTGKNRTHICGKSTL